MALRGKQKYTQRHTYVHICGFGCLVSVVTGRFAKFLSVSFYLFVANVGARTVVSHFFRFFQTPTRLTDGRRWEWPLSQERSVFAQSTHLAIPEGIIAWGSKAPGFRAEGDSMSFHAGADERLLPAQEEMARHRAAENFKSVLFVGR